LGGKTKGKQIKKNTIPGDDRKSAIEEQGGNKMEKNWREEECALWISRGESLMKKMKDGKLGFRCGEKGVLGFRL
jgi:hypothetical protein